MIVVQFVSRSLHFFNTVHHRFISIFVEVCLAGTKITLKFEIGIEGNVFFDKYAKILQSVIINWHRKNYESKFSFPLHIEMKVLLVSSN